MSNTPEKKGVSAVDFFCIGFGAIVGVGWAVAINGWMTSCGGPIPAAIGYIVALVMMVPIALCYCELVPMLPVAGGGMAFAYKAFNETVSFISGWAAFGAFVSIIPWEAIQITDVLGYLIPGIKTGPILYKVAGEPIYAWPGCRCFRSEDPVLHPGWCSCHRCHRLPDRRQRRQLEAHL